MIHEFSSAYQHMELCAYHLVLLNTIFRNNSRLKRKKDDPPLLKCPRAQGPFCVSSINYLTIVYKRTQAQKEKMIHGSTHALQHKELCAYHLVIIKYYI